MKKTLLFSVAAIVAAFALMGCEKDVVTTPVTIDLLPKAHIVGVAGADLDLQSAGVEAAPQGSKLIVEVNYSDIDPTVTNGKWMDTITIGQNGEYDIAVPTDANGVTVTVTPVSFEAPQTQIYGALNTIVTKTFAASSFTVPIRSGISVTKNFGYTATNLPLYTDIAFVSGKCTANLSSEMPGLENVPDGTKIIFYNGEWADSTTVKSGSYSIIVPDEKVSYKAEFVATKRVWVNNNVDYTQSGYQNISYKYSVAASLTPVSARTTLDLSFGEGVDQTIDPNANTTVLSGTASADIDWTISGNEPIPNGTKIYFYTNTWGATATVSNGTYTVNIPRSTVSGETINYQLSFTAIRKTSSTNSASYNFTGAGSVNPTTFSTMTRNIVAN